MICPVCVANAAAVVMGAGTAGGGLSAAAWRVLRWRRKAGPRNFLPVNRNAGRGRVLAAGETAQR